MGIETDLYRPGSTPSGQPVFLDAEKGYFGFITDRFIRHAMNIGDCGRQESLQKCSTRAHGGLFPPYRHVQTNYPIL